MLSLISRDKAPPCSIKFLAAAIPSISFLFMPGRLNNLSKVPYEFVDFILTEDANLSHGVFDCW